MSLSQTFKPSYRPLWLRLINSMGSTLKSVNVPLASLSEESLLAAALRQTRLSDWGDDSFRLPFNILLQSLEKEANLNFFGRYLFRQRCIRVLANRLRIQEDLKRYPEILQVPICRPLFIVGLPRTGTTLLHNLLSQDPANRTLLLWELLSPSPPPDSQTRQTDPRIAATNKLIKGYYNLVPKLREVHYVNPTGPEECNFLFEHGFTSLIFEVDANVPRYGQWLEKHNMVAPYQYYRQQLQLLGWHCSGERWVLKAPAHLFNLEALLTVFPDACIVHIHRNLLKVLPSLCSLSSIVRGIYSDQLDLRQIGEYWINRSASGLDHAMQVRSSADPSQFYDLNYKTLFQDPTGTVRQIYEYFGYKFDTYIENTIKTWITQNPQHKYGIHRYSLEQFRIDPMVVNRRFARYRERFGVAE